MLNKFVVERDLAEVAHEDDAAEVIARARHLLAGTGIVWTDSFRGGGKLYSVYLATDEALVHATARAAGPGSYRLTRVVSTVHPGRTAA